MEHLVTSPAAVVVTAVTDVVVGVPSPSIQQRRHQRIAELREALRTGEYQVAAGDLADALLAAARRAN
jgi:anti-sigma28 factor (negative regulator of flagellin synthesis)